MTAAAAIDLPYDVVCDSSDREAWVRHRATGVGASEIAAVLGESHWESAIGVYARKVGVQTDDEAQTEAQFWGLKLEKIIAEVYSERANRPCRWSGIMLRSKAHPWATATLDAETSEKHGGAWWPFDSKTATVFKTGDWSDGPPREYYLQAQQQMLVTGARKATIACLLGGQRLVWCDIERDDVEIRRIVHAGRIFWEQCVQARVQPRPDGSESSKRALAALYPKGEPKTVQLDSHFGDLYDELSELKKTAKTIEARIAQIENDFKAALGTAETGVLPNLNVVTWKERRGSIDYKKAAEDAGLTVAQFEKYRRKNTRTFLLHDRKQD